MERGTIVHFGHNVPLEVDNMNLRARAVLEDCRGALEDLNDRVQGNEWRRRWVAMLALLRAVGHVLQSIDAKRDPKFAEAINREWNCLLSSKPEPKIFWEFILQERNNIIKRYEIHAGQGVTIDLTAGTAVHNYPITAGPFSGKDQRVVVRMAIDWWDNYLKRIETQV